MTNRFSGFNDTELSILGNALRTDRSGAADEVAKEVREKLQQELNRELGTRQSQRKGTSRSESPFDKDDWE